MNVYLTTFYLNKNGRMYYSVDEIKVRKITSSDYSLMLHIREFSEEYFTALNKMIEIKVDVELNYFQYCILTLDKFDVEKHLDKIKCHLMKKSHFDKFYDW